jgi:hypothetical protein
MTMEGNTKTMFFLLKVNSIKKMEEGEIINTPPEGPHDNGRKYKNYLSIEGGLYKENGGGINIKKERI